MKKSNYSVSNKVTNKSVSDLLAMNLSRFNAIEVEDSESYDCLKVNTFKKVLKIMQKQKWDKIFRVNVEEYDEKTRTLYVVERGFKNGFFNAFIIFAKANNIKLDSDKTEFYLGE